MKIRYGFVSNNSSSSFVLNDVDYLDIVNDIKKALFIVLNSDFNKTINEVVSDKMVDEWFSITRLDKNFYQVHQKIDNYDVEEILTDIFGEYPVRDN